MTIKDNPNVSYNGKYLVSHEACGGWVHYYSESNNQANCLECYRGNWQVKPTVHQVKMKIELMHLLLGFQRR